MNKKYQIQTLISSYIKMNAWKIFLKRDVFINNREKYDQCSQFLLSSKNISFPISQLKSYVSF